MLSDRFRTRLNAFDVLLSMNERYAVCDVSRRLCESRRKMRKWLWKAPTRSDTAQYVNQLHASSILSACSITLACRVASWWSTTVPNHMSYGRLSTCVDGFGHFRQRPLTCFWPVNARWQFWDFLSTHVDSLSTCRWRFAKVIRKNVDTLTAPKSEQNLSFCTSNSSLLAKAPWDVFNSSLCT